MNQIYHIVQGYRNWQKYFHTASLDWYLERREAQEYFDSDLSCRIKWWTIEIKLTFYYDSFFKKKKVDTVISSYIEKFPRTTSDEKVNEKFKSGALWTIEKYEEMIDEIKASSEYTGQKENVKEKLLAEAKECMLLDNPLKTGLFLAKLIETLEKKEA